MRISSSTSIIAFDYSFFMFVFELHEVILDKFVFILQDKIQTALLWTEDVFC